MDYEKFYQAVVLAYINHDGDSVRFFDEVVAALNQFREEKQAAEQITQTDGATLCEHGKGHCQCDNTRCRNYCD